MIKSNSHNYEKIVQKTLYNLSINKYSTIAITVHIYALLLFIFEHYLHKHQN